MSDALTLRLMTRDEVTELVDRAADEGWNPGHHDADVFWATDPEAFIAVELEGEVIGGGAITSYGGEFGFMGLCIMRPEHRGRGLGRRLWEARVRLLRARLRTDATIGLDGLPEMEAWYATGGFELSHRTIRYRGLGNEWPLAPGVLPLADVPFEAVAAYDRRCFPAQRERFLRPWFEQPESMALVSLDGDRLRGYGVIRRCGEGARIGPLFADDAAIARALYASLAAFRPGEPVYLDVPEVNAWAMGLMQRLGMREVLSRVRMYRGPAPRVEESRVFGITTFELG